MHLANDKLPLHGLDKIGPFLIILNFLREVTPMERSSHVQEARNVESVLLTLGLNLPEPGEI